MFPIPYWRLIGIHVQLAIIAFGITEFPVYGNGIPASETCVNVSGEIICYFKGSENTVAWNEARELCNSFTSTLPIIRNGNDQDAVAGFLKSHSPTDNSAAWTAGRNITYSDWIWINGETATENEVQDRGEDYAVLGAGLEFIALAASEELPYICQYEGAYCNTFRDIDVPDKCLRLSNDNRTWYDARNQCLMSNGDLAVIRDEVHGYLKEKLTENQKYWIGLRKKSWRWTLNDDAESNDEIKYTNWLNVFATDGECISIDASDGKWRAVACPELKTVVCQRGQAVTSPATTTQTSVATQTKVNSITSVSEESTTGGSQSSILQMFAAVGAGIVIIICIIVIIFFVLRTKKGRNRQSRPSYSSPQNKREEFDTRITNAPVYTSINESPNAPVTTTSDDIRGVYAEIPMSTANQLEDEATDQQPGIVYASLEFKDVPTCLESDKTNANTTAPVKVGPLGDIYAMPDAKGYAVTSPGNDSASQSVKVTPQGEVVYANLQAEMLGKEQASEEHDHTK